MQSVVIDELIRQYAGRARQLPYVSNGEIRSSRS